MLAYDLLVDGGQIMLIVSGEARFTAWSAARLDLLGRHPRSCPLA
jgi:hypothetical protein